jgi:hypothetical protein
MTNWSQHHTKWRTTETVPLKVRNETGLSPFSTPIQYNFGILRHSNKTRAINEIIQIGKKEVKLSLFADDMILYLRDPKSSTKKLLEIINSWQVAEYNISIQKSVAILCTNNTQRKKSGKQPHLQ